MADYGDPVVSPDFEGEKKDNKIWIIIAVVAIVLCCCCLIVGGGIYYLWNNGDQMFDLSMQLSHLLL